MNFFKTLFSLPNSIPPEDIAGHSIIWGTILGLILSALDYYQIIDVVALSKRIFNIE